MQVLSDDSRAGHHFNGSTPNTPAVLDRGAPELRFAASVALRFDAPLSVGATPDGVRFDFRVHGTVEGPMLSGTFPPCAAYLLIDPDGIGTILVRAPLLLRDGAIAELEATGRYDFGRDGYERAVAGDLPNSALGWCPRFLTGDPRYLWLNRALCLGVGELRPLDTSVDYDLFVLAPRAPLYERLGGGERIGQIMSAFIEALHGNPELSRQNPAIAAALRRVNTPALKQKVAALVGELTGGHGTYVGRPLRAAHAHLHIGESDWSIAVGELERILNEHRIQPWDQRELLASIERFKPEIVTAR